MRIVICAVQVPFMRGGADHHCENLYNEMLKRDINVQYVTIPFKWYPPEEIINSCLCWRFIDLSEANGEKIDAVIATKFPSYLVRHPNKVVWLLHQHRPAYDLANTEFDDLAPYGKLGEIVRKRIHRIDNIHLQTARKIYTNSKNVQDRLWQYNSIKGEILYHPPPLLSHYRCDSYDDYIFYPSRLDLLKRQELVIESMQFIKAKLRLKIAGAGPSMDHYKALAKKLKVDDKIDFLGYVSDNELIDLYAHALCVTYTPFDEDYGYVTLESFLSKKPLITCLDSGGPLEFVDDSLNGFITSPSAKDIAGRIDQLYKGETAQVMGENGYDKIASLNLTWDNVIHRLMESIK